MEENLHSINALRTMEIIDINTGSKIGFIKDIKINQYTNKVVSIIIPGEQKGWFSKSEDIEITWDKIIKVGFDVLLVNYSVNCNNDVNY
ncbi:MAG: YlmC/YmxH family sporulation protein [Clostridiales bacterium]|nr:YlmC/YmxH family sporulation protein [Clostridiales bacterium]